MQYSYIPYRYRTRYVQYSKIIREDCEMHDEGERKILFEKKSFSHKKRHGRWRVSRHQSWNKTQEPVDYDNITFIGIGSIIIAFVRSCLKANYTKNTKSVNVPVRLDIPFWC